MSRKRNSNHDYLPSPDDACSIGHLPRDVRLGHTSPSQTKYLLGWDETTGTRQLWEVVDEETARFVGFVRSEP
jgi:hypothetical protein